MRGSTPSLLYLASIDFPHLKARAIQVVNTCHALARAGCSVTLVVGRREAGSTDEQLSRYGLAPHGSLRIIGVPAVRLPPSSPAPIRGLYTRFWSWSYLLSCLAMLPRLLRDRPHAVLARDYRLAWVMLAIRRAHRTPLAFEVHGLPSAELLDGPTTSPQTYSETRRLRRLEEQVFAGAEYLITITECLRRRLIEEYGVDPGRVATVPDASGSADVGPRTADVDGTSSDLRRPSPDLARLVYAGQLYPHKGVDLLLRMLQHLPGVELLIVGGLPDDPQLTRLEVLASELGVRGRVRFAGPRPYGQIPGLLATADVALLPLAEGIVARCFTSPLKLFDYLAAGLPIVAVDFPTLREVLRDGENGLLVPPNDPAAMAAAIRRLLDDPALAARLGERARMDAADYTWARRAERLLDALALSDRGRRLAERAAPVRSSTG